MPGDFHHKWFSLIVAFAVLLAALMAGCPRADAAAEQRDMCCHVCVPGTAMAPGMPGGRLMMAAVHSSSGDHAPATHCGRCGHCTVMNASKHAVVDLRSQRAAPPIPVAQRIAEMLNLVAAAPAMNPVPADEAFHPDQSNWTLRLHCALTL